MKKGITLKDMARKLNMSISTVSKSLSSDNSISASTKERVKELAKEWAYIPNESARHFKLNKSFTIGLILPDLQDQFFVTAINGVEEIAEKEKYNIILSQSHEDVIKEENIGNVMIKCRVFLYFLSLRIDSDFLCLSFQKVKLQLVYPLHKNLLQSRQ